MENIMEMLKEIGLSNKESEVYLGLLKNSPISGGELSKLLNLDRTHTYNLLNNLVSKGLASHILKQRKKLFTATSPINLLNEVEKKRNLISSIIPSLKDLQASKHEVSSVKILEGKEGLRDVVRMLFESKDKDICVYGGTGKSYEALKYEMPHIAKKTGTQHIKGRIITGKELKGKLFTKLKNFKIKYIDELTPSSTMIFGDRVSINVFDNKIFVIIIESKEVADSYRNYFEYLWKQAKP